MIKLNNYNNKNVAVLGLARSGMAAIKALQAGGATVIAWDDNPQVRASIFVEYKELLVAIEQWDWSSLAMLVVSPSIPLGIHPIVAAARANNVRVTCDISLLMEECKSATFIGITGTNGKSTTTALIAHCLSELGAEVECGGNIGVACLELEPLTSAGYYVLELSSYQLEAMDYGALNVACFLNITPDHLERHGSMENYIAAKERIFKGQGVNDRAIIAIDDEYSLAVANRTQNPIMVSAYGKEEMADYFMEGCMLIDKAGYELDLSLMESLRGVHNHQNALVAYAALRALGFEVHAIAQAMQSFKGLAHRMEKVSAWDNMLWVNDSKATNADAAKQSLAAYQNIYWIVGGALKQGGIESLAPLKSHVKRAYVIGAQTSELAQSLAQMGIVHEICGDMAIAVQAAHDAARGEQDAVILLAPAAASFDQYSNFEQRGEHFRELVLALQSEYH